MFSYASLFAVMAASLSAVSLGFDVGMISSTLVAPTFQSYFGHPSPAAIGGIVSGFAAGAVVGSFGCSIIADRFGRVKTYLSGAVVVLVGVALQAGAQNVGMLIAGRLITGLGAGQLTAVQPIYASEIAPPSIRGMLGGLQTVGIFLAIFLATATGYAFGTEYTSVLQWRGPLAVQAVPIVLLLLFIPFLPETPRFLISKGRKEDALRVLQRLHKGEGEHFVQGEYQEIVDQIEAEKRELKPSWSEIARRSSWRKRMILACVIQWFSQLTGVNCIQYYAATIYEKLGFATKEALALNLLYGALGFVFTVFWICVFDRVGRRPVMIGCSILIGAGLLVQAVLSQIYATKADPNPNALRAQVAMFYIFNLGFSAIGALAWLIPAEMLPLSIRAKGNSISVAVNYAAGIVVAQVSPIALTAIGFKFFYVFVAFDLIAAVVYTIWLPETSGLTLEQVDLLFGDQLVQHVLAQQTVPDSSSPELWSDDHSKEA